LRWPGTWKLLRTHWRAGVNEVILAGSKRAFVKACARYIPEIEVADIEKSTAGVRAQAVARDGSLVDDFIVSEMPGSIHVRNAPSPAATTSLSLGSLVADRAEDMLELPRGRNPVEV
jgi:2-hydroxyglutarate dehydrogenase